MASDPPRLVWLNGAFGVGKSTTARLIVQRDRRWRAFDPEWVGFMLRANLDEQPPGGDFQNLPSWRRLVPIVAREICDHTGDDVLAVQAVLSDDYWKELAEGIRANGLDLIHVLLDAEPAVLHQRIEASDDGAARQWRLDHVDRYLVARNWMLDAADLIINAGNIGPEAVAEKVLARIA